jgi:hypothetical protein
MNYEDYKLDPCYTKNEDGTINLIEISLVKRDNIQMKENEITGRGEKNINLDADFSEAILKDGKND